MKITRKDIKKMIMSELKEAVSPMDFSQGRDPSMTMGGGGSGFPAVSAPAEPGNPAYEHFVTLKTLYGTARAEGISDPDYDRFMTAVSEAGAALADYLGK